MTSLGDRFEAKVDRSGDHHLWTGAKRQDGAGHLKVDGRPVPARRVAWELAHGEPPPGAQVASCPDERACVRVEHLTLVGGPPPERARRRRSAGEGSLDKVGPGRWKLTIARGRYDDGKLRRTYRTIKADTEAEANRAAARIVGEVDDARLPSKQADRDLTIDEGIERYLDYLSDEKGREERTVRGYRQLHTQWFAKPIGQRRIRDVDEDDFDRIFGKMRRGGLSSSRMKEGVKLYKPFFRWAKRRGIVRRSPLADFELPKSSHVPKRRTPPEVEQVALILATSVEHTPDIAPLLTLAAVTGMRRGELVAVRRRSVRWAKGVLYVDEATDVQGVKHTKTDIIRDVSLDDFTLDMLHRVDNQLVDRAAAQVGIDLSGDAFLFSREPDASKPLHPEYMTRQLAKVKDLLGVPDKHPETIAMEDNALHLFREGDGQPRPPGRTGPRPKGALSYKEIGRRLGRSERWAWAAMRSAERREAAADLGEVEWFDGSLLGLRKFTSSELLDSGFNIAVVAERQGHDPQVLAKHYTKSRRSADRKAAAHLGRLIHHGSASGPDEGAMGL